MRLKIGQHIFLSIRSTYCPHTPYNYAVNNGSFYMSKPGTVKFPFVSKTVPIKNNKTNTPDMSTAHLRYLFFWDVKQCWLELQTFRDRTVWPLKMGQVGCPETSAFTYQSTLRNISEERIPHTAPGSLKSRIMPILCWHLENISFWQCPIPPTTLTDLRNSYVPEGPAQVGNECRLHTVNYVYVNM